MTEPSSLAEFLAIRQGEGRFFDTAEFTLDSLRAREKMARYQLEDSGLWLVKVVQAAVASGSESIRIGFGRRRVTVTFENNLEWNADDLLKEVLSGQIPADAALLHIVTGLRACSSSLNETVKWTAFDTEVSLSLQGTRVASAAPDRLFRLEVERPSRSRSLSRTLTSSVSQLVTQTVEEYDAVRSRCWVCPIPIFLDGRDMERGYGLVEGGEREASPFQVLMKHERSRSSAVHACIALRELSLQHGAVEVPNPRADLEMPEGERYVLERPVYRGLSFLQWHPEGARHGAVALISKYRAASRVDLVLHGAVVDSRELPDWVVNPKRWKLPGVTGNLGVRFVFGVRREQLDLSQFGVRDCDIEALVAEAAPQAVELCDKALDHMNRFWYVPLAPNYARPLAATLGLPLAGALLASKGIAMIPISFVVGVNSLVWREQVVKHLKAVRGMIKSKVSTEESTP